MLLFVKLFALWVNLGYSACQARTKELCFWNAYAVRLCYAICSLSGAHYFILFVSFPKIAI